MRRLQRLRRFLGQLHATFAAAAADASSATTASADATAIGCRCKHRECPPTLILALWESHAASPCFGASCRPTGRGLFGLFGFRSEGSSADPGGQSAPELRTLAESFRPFVILLCGI